MLNNSTSIIFDSKRAFRSLVIAAKMMRYFIDQNDFNRAKIAFLLGYVHDIGNYFGGDEDDNRKFGGEILKMSNYQYYQEVYYHGTGSDNYYSEELVLLELADMTTSEDGRYVRLDETLDSLRNFPGESSAEYKNFINRIGYLENHCDPDTLISIRDYFNNLAGGDYRGEVMTLDEYRLGTFFEEDDAAVFSYEDLIYSAVSDSE